MVLLNPEELKNNSVEEIHEAAIEEFGNLERLVRRNNGLVKAVLVNGKIAYENGHISKEVGEKNIYGQFLSAL